MTKQGIDQLKKVILNKVQAQNICETFDENNDYGDEEEYNENIYFDQSSMRILKLN